MTDHEFELKKLEIEADTRRHEIRADVRKVVYGTCIVGLAVAAFPFLQQIASDLFATQRANRQLAYEQRVKDLEIDLEQKRFELERQSSRREFLESIGSEGRSDDLYVRLALAQFYSFLSEEKDREQWNEFRKHVEGLLDRTDAAQAKVDNLAVTKDVSVEDLVAAQSELRQLQERNLISVPRGTQNAQGFNCLLVPGARFTTTLSLQAASEKYAVAEQDGRLNANRETIGPWERFQLVEHSNGEVSLCGSHGKYVVAEQDGRANANRVNIGPWERFEMSADAEGKVSFRTVHGTYLTAGNEGDLSADAKTLGPDAKFTIGD